ncbi:MAG: VWA domain-containing protein, partial [Planctomycetota bacterium]
APENDRERDDNLMEADIEIVDRKIRVLLLAGGPSRDYQFLRDQLHRDKTVISDIVLQSGQLGISQDANKILDDFPTTREELYEYDCVVAFDPDWTQLSAEQVDLLETWVAEQGGGLVVTTGPVNAGRAINSWVQDASPPMSKVRNLYPVEFPRRFSAVESKPYESDESWPLDFTREGIEADFLQITDSAVDSRRAWEAFPGVYGYFPVRGPKQGATVLARFSDPQTSQAGEQPVFLAWQFYGSGRVLFMGSAEFYRLRSEDTRYFEQFYIKLVRHISKGRLLRGSTRGMLLVGQERYRLGNTVSVQAYRLTNAQLEPLELPSVDLQVMEPDQSVQTVAMRPDPTRVGTYLGQFPVLKEGEYRLELPLPDSSDERLTQRILVEIPNLERERPQRNDAVLSQLAQTTGGQYFVGLSAILDPSIPLVSQLDDRTKTITLTASLSKEWEEQWLWWAMLALMGLLSLEWLLRRLFRLA